MAKFRYWCETLKQFMYWEDGNYFTIENNSGLAFRNYLNSNFYEKEGVRYLFNWLEAEQSTRILNVECFENDMLDADVKVMVSNQYDTYSKIKRFCCTLKKDEYGFYFNIQDRKRYLNNDDFKIIGLKVIGNTHEGVSNG